MGLESGFNKMRDALKPALNEKGELYASYLALALLDKDEARLKELKMIYAEAQQVLADDASSPEHKKLRDETRENLMELCEEARGVIGLT
jgi:hypothetical protein